MSDLDPVPEGVQLSRGEADLVAAVHQLRAVPQPRAVEIADRVLSRTLAAPRRSMLVRARPPRDYLRVSTLAITAVLREDLDTRLDGAAVGRIVLDVNRDEELTALTIELYVQYGTVILTTADRARLLAGRALAGLLGDPAPTDEIVVTLSHVHVSDVTAGDPHLVDPIDEGDQ